MVAAIVVCTVCGSGWLSTYLTVSYQHQTRSEHFGQRQIGCRAVLSVVLLPLCLQVLSVLCVYQAFLAKKLYMTSVAGDWWCCCCCQLAVQARYRIRQVSLALFHSWRPLQHSIDQQPSAHSSRTCIQQNKDVQSNGQHHAGSTAARTAPPAGVISNGCSAGDGLEAGIARLRSTQPGAFPSALLEARDRETGLPLSGEQVTTSTTGHQLQPLP